MRNGLVDKTWRAYSRPTPNTSANLLLCLGRRNTTVAYLNKRMQHNHCPHRKWKRATQSETASDGLGQCAFRYICTLQPSSGSSYNCLRFCPPMIQETRLVVPAGGKPRKPESKVATLPITPMHSGGAETPRDAGLRGDYSHGQHALLCCASFI
jgi:hypothetical protein